MQTVQSTVTIVSPGETEAGLLPPSSELLSSLENSPDVVSWINDILDGGSSLEKANTVELTELDRSITGLIGTLEIASEDTTSSVERLIEDISRGASRLAYDLHFMRDGALSLQAVLQNVESKAKASLVAETNAALERLHFLDTVRRNMEAAREVLREAESWGALESDVTSLLGEKNYEKAAERLSEANKSMAVFANTPEYETRRTLMVSLQNQLEAALSSALVAAVSSQDVAVCRSYFAIFCNIQRETEFRNYYYGSRRASLVEVWQSVPLRDCEGVGAQPNPAAQTFSAFLPTFYASFLSTLQFERTSIPAIFPNPLFTLSTLITSTLSSLQPSFSQRLASVSTYHGTTALRELIAAYRATEEAASSIEKIFEKVGYSALLTPAAAPEVDGSASRAHLRRRSSARMSMSRRMSTHRMSTSNAVSEVLGISNPGMLLLEWDTELFAPFSDFQADYGTLEWRLLEDTLGATLCSTPSAQHTDRARVLRERAVDVFSAAEDAIGRCTAFTHGYGAHELVGAVDQLIRSFCDTTRADIASRASAAMSSATAATVSEEELADLDYTPEDWVEIQTLLHLLEAVRALQERTVTFEGKLRVVLGQISAGIRAARQDHNNIGGLTGGTTTRGAIQMLIQSSLNSAALHGLLESVDPEPIAQLGPSVPPSPDARRSSFMSPNLQTPAAAIPLLTDSRAAIASLAHACQVALQQTILGPLHGHLATYASLTLWTAVDSPSNASAASASAISAIRVPTFSLSPSGTMARVAEGLLSLPRLFEVYADDDALAVSLETLPHISKKLLSALAEPAAAPSQTSPPHPHPHPHPSELKSRRSSSFALLPGQTQAFTQPSVEEMHFSPEAVTAAWLASLTRTLLAHLTRDVLPQIPRLTPTGAAQLAADLGWLANIAEALNVEWPPLGRWRRWVEEEEEEGKRKVNEGLEGSKDSSEKESQDTEGGDEDEADKEEQVVKVVSRLRGWSTS